ncbi:GntT/GntP/DsdX family permease [Streptomyces sp. NPDC004009]
MQDVTESRPVSPNVLAWLIAVLLRGALGSATVALVSRPLRHPRPPADPRSHRTRGTRPA